MWFHGDPKTNPDDNEDYLSKVQYPAARFALLGKNVTVFNYCCIICNCYFFPQICQEFFKHRSLTVITVKIMICAP